MLHDSNRPLRLQFYPSLRPEMTMGTDRSHRAVPYLRSWFTHGQAQFSSVIYHSTRKQLLIDRARLEPAEVCGRTPCQGLMAATEVAPTAIVNFAPLAQ